MAAGDNVKFPVPIMFNDNSPKPGFARVCLTVREMQVKKPVVGKHKAKNAEITPSFSNGVVLVRVVVTVAGESVPVVYEYKKNLPYDVDEKNCKCEVHGNGDSLVVVILAKANKNESWASQDVYFMQRPTTE